MFLRRPGRRRSVNTRNLPKVGKVFLVMEPDPHQVGCQPSLVFGCVPLTLKALCRTIKDPLDLAQRQGPEAGRVLPGFDPAFQKGRPV